MKYAILGKTDALSEQLKERIKTIMNKAIYDKQSPDIVFTIGGDGTALRAVNQYSYRLDKTVFLTINTGNLGFFTNFLPSDIKQIEKLLKEEIRKEYFSLIEYRVKTKEELFSGLALNEITISNPPKVSFLTVEIDNEHFESFKGTGLLVSTPIGSTAYNKSLGGAVIDPSLITLQLTEISSINSNSYKTLGSSLVICGSKKISIKGTAQSPYLFTADFLQRRINDLEEIEIKIAEQKVAIVKTDTKTFFDRVKKAFL